MEAANHGNPRSFYLAVTVVLEQLKREELKRKTQSQRNEAYFRFFLQAFCFPQALSCNLRWLGCEIKNLQEMFVM
jgi:hypothetical protein